MVSITGNAWLNASTSALSDIFGRGTVQFAEASSRVCLRHDGVAEKVKPGFPAILKY